MSWEKYYEKNKDRSLRPLYSRAVKFLSPNAKVAVDLGCGIGTEALDLLKRGLEVHALDREAKALELLKSQAAVHLNLHAHVSSFEAWEHWPETDFLFAYHSFPFCGPESFDKIVARALGSVANDGIFAVSFFGLEDEWVQAGQVVGISEFEVKSKLKDFEVLYFEEIKKIGPTALQGDKMWNVIEVVARRK